MPIENKKGKHLTFVDRVAIEHCLSYGWLLKDIALRLGKDSTTISKEVKRNRMRSNDDSKIPCGRKSNCDVKNLCSPSCGRLCSKCIQVNCLHICNHYEPRKCRKLMKFPYVCNTCNSRNGCFCVRYRYSAQVAEANYRNVLATSRQGVDLTTREFKHLDDLISSRIKKGQSLYHIYESNKDKIGCSLRTLYNYFEQNLFTARNIDLPRKIRFKKRKKRKPSAPSAQKHTFGRNYNDFTSFIEQNPDIPVVEMDTLKGKREEGKVFLTLFFRNSSFMLAFVLDSCSQECVKRAIDELYNTLGHDVFTALFPVLLTDNGSEMKAPLDIEQAACGRKRTKVFYCDPMNSNQKSKLEKNHQYLRYIFPKGKSLELYSQEDVTLAINNINSARRASINGNCPFQLAHLLFDHSLFEKFGLFRIPADDVILKPLLLKK
jgi:IS30 family transposase